MMESLVWTCVIVLLLLSFMAVYQWVLAIASVLPVRPVKIVPVSKRSRFLLLIPAHNEERSLPRTLESLAQLRYPTEGGHIVVAADRCDDGTAMVARKYGVQCIERLGGRPGKGAAIAWAIGELQKDLGRYDALIILDADTVVDYAFLDALDEGLKTGHQIQQAYNYLSNPWETLFTCLIAATSTLRNKFYYTGKSVIGLSGMLMGTGMCFSRQVMQHHGWTAFSVGEDLEFSVSLLLAGERIHFNSMARVFARESQGFRQASPQRLRWAGGRHAVAFSGSWKLFRDGVRLKRPWLMDAGLTLVAPTYSTQAVLAISCLLVGLFFAKDQTWNFLFLWSLVVSGSLIMYFLLGVAGTSSPLRTLAGIALVPVFLPWRMVIELLGFLGFGRTRWVRTARVSASQSEVEG